MNISVFNMISVFLGILLLIYALTVVFRIWEKTEERRLKIWWSILGVLVGFFLCGYVLFLSFLFFRLEIGNLTFLVAQVFFFGAVFVVLCFKLFQISFNKINEAGQALRESEDRFRTLYENSTIGLYRTTPDGRIHLANPALIRMLGYSSFDDLSNRNLEKNGFEPFYPRTQFVEIIEKDGEVKGLESSWKRKDGTIIFVRESARAIRDSQAKTLYYDGTVEDITERKRAEEAVRKNEEKYRGLTENINLGIYRNTVGPEGKFIEANPAIIGMFGYKSKEEFLAINVSDLYQNPKDRNKFNDKMLKEGFVRDEKLWLKKKDGSPFFGSVSAVAVNDEQGHVKYYDGIIDDITERKRAEEVLRESEARYRTLFDESLDGICLADAETGLIIDCNQALAALVGRERAEMIGQYQTILHPPYNDQMATSPTFRQHLAHKEGHTLETQVVTSAGIIREVEIIANQLNFQGRKTLLGVFHDIAERKRTEKINAAVYKISEITNNAENLEELFASIHSIISELMPARNFYIALYDPETGLLSFPYHKDEFDEAPPPQPLRRGLTDYVLRQGEPLLADPVKFLELETSGEVESIGAPSIDWLGVPLKVKDKTIGVLVVQTYTEGVRYKKEDRDMLMFVSMQAAVAIERKKAETTLRASLHEKEVLLKEIHHRVKNNMQVISSLFNLQAGHTTNEECRGILKEGQTRIRSMSLVHEKLYQSRDLSKIDFADYIQSLAVHLFHSYLVNPAQVRMETEFEDVSVDINSAVPCGLILNELISNVLKHAFPEGRTGVIKIGMRRGPGGAVELRVADDGVGLPEGLDFRKAESFGLQIVNLLVDQLEAAIDLDRTKGTAFTMTFRELKYAPRV